MFDALYIGATGMRAQQLNVDTVANNLANVNTPGFKKARVSFVDLMRDASGAAAAAIAAADGELQAGPLAAPPQVGAGVGLGAVARVFEPGELRQTGSVFDVAIQGDGFLEVTLPDGTPAYARGGTLHVDATGALVTQAGFPLRAGIQVPPDATGLSISADGTVRIAVPGRAAPMEAGRLELVRFANPSGLVSQGGNVYRASDASGEAMTGRPGEDGAGVLAQGFLEASNVSLVDEMVNLMIAQRAYEASVKVVQASDEMLGMVNGLRR